VSVGYGLGRLRFTSIATYLRCGGVVNNQDNKGLLLSLSVKKIIMGEYLCMYGASVSEGLFLPWCPVNIFNTLRPTCILYICYLYITSNVVHSSVDKEID